MMSHDRGAIETASGGRPRQTGLGSETNCRLRVDLTVFAEMTYFDLDSEDWTAMMVCGGDNRLGAARVNKQGVNHG